MDELEAGGERNRITAILAGKRRREKQQRRTKELPAHRQEMAAHLADERKVARDDARHLGGNAIELRPYRRLDFGERCLGRKRYRSGHHFPLRPTATIR